MTEMYVACTRCGSPALIKTGGTRSILCASCKETTSNDCAPITGSLKTQFSAGGIIDLRKVMFSCAKNGGEFYVTFTRNASEKMFRIRSIDIVPAGAATTKYLDHADVAV